MPAVTTDLCIGSYPTLPAQTMSVTANAVTADVVLASRSYYLYDTTAYGADWSLIDRLESAIATHAELVGQNVTVVLQRDLRVRIDADINFTLTWPVDGVLRDLLGFTGNLSPAADSHTAPDISPLIWSAGRTASYRARLDTSGTPVHDTAVGQAATGVVTATRHNTLRSNAAIWRYVANSRIWTTDEENGEFFVFWQEVLSRARRFKIWRNTTEDSASTTAITLGTALPLSATATAYVHIPPQPVEFPYGREFGFHEYLHPVTIECMTSPEYTA